MNEKLILPKLHLGCGQRYLQGYVNIDFPSKEHSVQTKSIADKLCDITQLSYENQKVQEVRLHHVFEHFPRPQACAMICAWQQWLVLGGEIRIEVPDFDATAKYYMRPWRRLFKKGTALRHLFGSHEAHWAIHCEGYTRQTLQALLKAAGFEKIYFKKNSWRGTFNIEAFATKAVSKSFDEQIHDVSKYLELYLVDASEHALLEEWINLFQKHFKLCAIDESAYC